MTPEFKHDYKLFDYETLMAYYEASQQSLKEALTTIDQQQREIDRLEKLVYVPGLLRCAKCKFQLHSMNLNAHDGTVTANNKPDDCPNGCGPLWKFTEREAGNDLIDRFDKSWDVVKAAIEWSHGYTKQSTGTFMRDPYLAARLNKAVKSYEEALTPAPAKEGGE